VVYGVIVIRSDLGKNDLKIGPVKAQLECVRTY
jgi:hypothetical protein